MTEKRARGYEPTEVEDFLRRARASFDERDGAVTSADIRSASFRMVRRGYQPEAVDAALTRIEDALAQRERSAAIAQRGARAWVDDARSTAQVIVEHLQRPAGARFARTGILGYGYDRAEVDHVCERITAFLRDGEEITAEQLRSAAFRMKLRGYREEQVDALIDATIDVVLAVK
ncbi:DivIVA domain-containing protein [Microbacterium sp. YY-01]|uniref:DivIVA domain-containing protein n=1 Tax=Microbacterium sp. YY-01 TaxID=3421634 RepID=UPI003D1641AC